MYNGLIANIHLFHMSSILQDADKKGLSKIADEVKQLAQKAKEGSLKPEDYEVRTMVFENHTCDQNFSQYRFDIFWDCSRF